MRTRLQTPLSNTSSDFFFNWQSFFRCSHKRCFGESGGNPDLFLFTTLIITSLVSEFISALFFSFISLLYQDSSLNGIKVQVFFGKNTEKKHLCHHDKNYCFFYRSNIRVINLFVGCRNMIKLSKNMSL